MTWVKRRQTNANLKSISNLCPNCFSTLVKNEDGDIECSGDKLKFWKDEVALYKKMNVEQQKIYLESLENANEFLRLAAAVETAEALDCGYSANLVSIIPNYSTRIPDPMAVNKLERKLKRLLTEEELEEGYTFKLDNEIYMLPFINFPEDV